MPASTSGAQCRPSTHVVIQFDGREYPLRPPVGESVVVLAKALVGEVVVDENQHGPRQEAVLDVHADFGLKLGAREVPARSRGWLAGGRRHRAAAAGSRAEPGPGSGALRSGAAACRFPRRPPSPEPLLRRRRRASTAGLPSRAGGEASGNWGKVTTPHSSPSPGYRQEPNVLWLCLPGPPRICQVRNSMCNGAAAAAHPSVAQRILSALPVRPGRVPPPGDRALEPTVGAIHAHSQPCPGFRRFAAAAASIHQPPFVAAGPPMRKGPAPPLACSILNRWTDRLLASQTALRQRERMRRPIEPRPPAPATGVRPL